jgi:hypothetical protein
VARVDAMVVAFQLSWRWIAGYGRLLTAQEG